MEENLQGWPFLGAQKPPCARRKNESVPSGYGERADEEVLVGRQMRGQVKGRRELERISHRYSSGQVR